MPFFKICNQNILTNLLLIKKIKFWIQTCNY